MSWKSLVVVLGLAGSMVGGCGGDDNNNTNTDLGVAVDLGSQDAATDTGIPVDMATPSDLGTDAGADMGVISGACDPWDPTSCPDDATGARKCTTVLRGTGETAALSFECVPNRVGADRVGLGVVCSRFSRDLPDGASYDPCRQGLFCWTDPANAGLQRCQTTCGGDGAPDCAADEYCPLLADDPTRFGVCTPTDNCDPNTQTGCGEGDSCYWVFGGTGVPIGNCFPFSPPDGGTGAPGSACQFIDSCQGGTQCFPEVFEDGGTGTVNLCRTLCDPTAEATVCSDGQTCKSLIDTNVDGGLPDAGLPIPNIGICQ